MPGPGRPGWARRAGNHRGGPRCKVNSMNIDDKGGQAVAGRAGPGWTGRSWVWPGRAGGGPGRVGPVRAKTGWACWPARLALPREPGHARNLLSETWESRSFLEKT